MAWPYAPRVLSALPARSPCRLPIRTPCALLLTQHGRGRAHRATRHACLRHVSCATPACATPACAMPACLRDALRLRDLATPRTCHPAPPCDPVRLCTYALSAPQQAAHTAWRAISALPSRGEPSQSFPAPCSAESDFPNSQLPRSAPDLCHNTAAP